MVYTFMVYACEHESLHTCAYTYEAQNRTLGFSSGALHVIGLNTFLFCASLSFWLGWQSSKLPGCPCHGSLTPGILGFHGSAQLFM